jgi:prepilin-type N-terminal cleavage/methylation domain-containing protein
MNQRRGFTFIELLVAMIFFGILTAIAVPRYRLYKERAYLATLKSDLGNVRIAEEEYFAEQQRYATDTAALGYRVSSKVALTLTSQDAMGGYAAVATHVLLPGQQCATYVGRDAANVISGQIVCGTANTSSVGQPTP